GQLEGLLQFANHMRYVTNARDEQVAISRNGEIVISDENGRERERHKVPYGATLTTKAGARVRAGHPLANWCPLTRPIITEYAGETHFENVEECVTVARHIYDTTGL